MPESASVPPAQPDAAEQMARDAAMAEQLQSQPINLLVPYLGTGSYAGRFFLKPGPINYGEEKMPQLS